MSDTLNDPIYVRCVGSNRAPAGVTGADISGAPIVRCGMCNLNAVVVDGLMPEHDRLDVIAMLDRARAVCESCGARAAVTLADGSHWCSECDGAARRLGYDDAAGSSPVPEEASDG